MRDKKDYLIIPRPIIIEAIDYSGHYLKALDADSVVPNPIANAHLFLKFGEIFSSAVPLVYPIPGLKDKGDENFACDDFLVTRCEGWPIEVIDGEGNLVYRTTDESRAWKLYWCLHLFFGGVMPMGVDA